MSLLAVLDAVRAGARTPAEVARRCGLDVEVARVGLDELARAGMLSAQSLGSECPATGCRTCPTGCGTPSRTGPVEVGLRGWTATATL